MTDDIDFAKVTLACLGKNTPGVDTFKNRKKSMVAHLQKDARADQEQKIGTTWVWVYDDNVVLGYVSLAMHSIYRKDIQNNQDRAIADKFPYSSIPALLIGQLATHKAFEGRGMGTLMVSWVIDLAAYLSEKIGCRVVALHPEKDVIRWYQKLQFKIVNREDKQDIMYFDILKRNHRQV